MLKFLEVAYLPSWDFELDFRVGLSSLDFELDFRVGFLSWIFELGFFFAGLFLAAFPINFQFLFLFCFFFAQRTLTSFCGVFKMEESKGGTSVRAVLFNLIFWTENNSWHLNECF